MPESTHTEQLPIAYRGRRTPRGAIVEAQTPDGGTDTRRDAGAQRDGGQSSTACPGGVASAICSLSSVHCFSSLNTSRMSLY